MVTGRRSLFLSYAHAPRDTAFVSSLADRLRGDGEEVWLDAGIAPGIGWEAVLHERILSARCVLVVLTPDALASAWVAKEWRLALAAGRPVLPLRLSDCQPPEELARIQWINFSGDIDTAYVRLLTHLPPRLAAVSPEVLGFWGWSADFRFRACLAELQGRLVAAYRGVWIPTAWPEPVRLFECPSDGIVDADEQLAQVMAHSRLRGDRVAEILAAREKKGASFFAAASESVGIPATPHMVELITVAAAVTESLVMVLKAYTATTEPAQRSRLVVPLVPPDGIPSMPSVRATLGSLRSELLRGLMATDDERQARVDILDAFARRGGMNEVVAGTHFVSDVVAGYHLGIVVGRSLKALAGEGPPPQPWDGRLPDTTEMMRAVEERVSARAPQVDGVYRVDPAPLWRELWGRAVQEVAASATR